MSNCRIKRERNQKVKLPNVELNECRIKREGSVLREESKTETFTKQKHRITFHR